MEKEGLAYSFIEICITRSPRLYPHGMQFINTPKISMNRKKNITIYS